MKKILVCLLAVIMVFGLVACGQKDEPEPPASPETRVIVDSKGREVEIPGTVESIVCVGVGALRYSCYMEAADLVVGIEDYELEKSMSRLYNYVNFDKFDGLPVIGTNGSPFAEEIIKVKPDAIVMTSYAEADPDELQSKTGIPVVVVPGSDTTLDEQAYDTIKIMGELYAKEDRAEALTAYLKAIEKDLNDRTADIKDADKPSVYVGGVSFKGNHGFEGTEAFYGPLELIHAKNLANETGQEGAFNIDLEQVLNWDPEIIFVDFNGLELVNKDYAVNPNYYNSLSAVKEGKVYSQISFRSSASNLETALADAYYAGKVVYPEKFEDVNPAEKAGEIFKELIGSNPYEDLKGAGYEFRSLVIGE